MKKFFWPNKDTKKFISMSINPGNTGANLHNRLFQIYKLNNIYIPLKISTIKQAKQILKNFDFNGCSLSMPFKESLISSVDKLDYKAKKIGSINTILNKKNKLIGFNTDYYASREIIKKQKLQKNYKVMILGSGGVAKAIYHSFYSLKFKNIFIACRDKKKFNKIRLNKKLNFIKWEKRNNIKVDIIFNATPLGMFGKYSNKIPIKISNQNLPKIIFDLAVNQKGNLLSKTAKKNKIKYVSGLEYTRIQGIKQFEIYNSIKTSDRKLKKISFF